MCAPVITSVTFDKTSYKAGQTITATVNYTSCCSETFSVAGIDTGSHIWAVTFNDGVSVATLTTTA